MVDEDPVDTQGIYEVVVTDNGLDLELGETMRLGMFVMTGRSNVVEDITTNDDPGPTKVLAVHKVVRLGLEVEVIESRLVDDRGSSGSHQLISAAVILDLDWRRPLSLA